MRKFRLKIELPIGGADIFEDFEVEDDASQDEIDEIAKMMFFNYCNYGCTEITEGNNDDQTKI